MLMGSQQPEGMPQPLRARLSLNEHEAAEKQVRSSRPMRVLKCVFVCLHRVVGPAVTFKVRPNSQNVSTADVADLAGRCPPWMTDAPSTATEKKKSRFGCVAAPEAAAKLMRRALCPLSDAHSNVTGSVFLSFGLVFALK